MPPKQAKRMRRKSDAQNEHESSGEDELDDIRPAGVAQLTDSSDLFCTRQDPQERLQIRQTYSRIREQIQC